MQSPQGYFHYYGSTPGVIAFFGNIYWAKIMLKLIYNCVTYC